jgi:hypothetical protein
MNHLEKNGNLLEAGLWFFIALVVLVRSFLDVPHFRRCYHFLTVAFLIFGISDLIEAQTGAWWRPWWLLVLKAACLAAFVFGFREYYRLRKIRDG